MLVDEDAVRVADWMVLVRNEKKQHVLDSCLFDTRSIRAFTLCTSHPHLAVYSPNVPPLSVSGNIRLDSYSYYCLNGPYFPPGVVCALEYALVLWCSASPEILDAMNGTTIENVILG